jgi:glycine oxidase
MSKNRISIIGGGVLGLSISFELIELGIEVTNIYPSGRAGGASQCAAAMLNSFAEIDKYALSSPYFQRYFKLSRNSTIEWPRFEDRLVNALRNLSSNMKDCLYTREEEFINRGTFVLNNTTASELDDDNYDAIRDALVNYKEPFKDVDPDDIPGYFPESRARALRALKIDNEGWLNPKLLMDNLDRVLKGSGLYTHVDSSADSLLLNNGIVQGVLCRDGKVYDSDRFIVAAGFDSTRLFDRSGLHDIVGQKIYSGVGVSLEIEISGEQKNCIRTPNRGGACGIYTAPYSWGTFNPNNRVLVGASNFISVEPQYFGRTISISHLMDAATREVNQEFYNSKLITVNVGNRPTTFDQYPMIGRTEIPNLIFCSGTKRDGIHCAPIIAKYLCNIAMEIPDAQGLDDVWELLDPRRRVLIELTVEDSIRMNVESLISEAYQHGYVPATIRGREQFERSLTNEVTEVHNRTRISGRGIPPLMYKLIRNNEIEYPL